ncbi:MAG: hypothetical protein M1816_001411 [Peltula sp. TS41687]|nr:MAG: hypothetical protein M1816_001411 [Peltula sp. TS41687]
MAISYKRIISSNPFKFLVGSERKLFTVHAALITHHSEALGALLGGGMREAKEGCALLEEVDEDTFVRFIQYAYTGDYIAAYPEILLSPSLIGNTGSDTPTHKQICPTPPEAGDVAADAVADAPVEETIFAELDESSSPATTSPWAVFGNRDKKKHKSKWHTIIDHDNSFGEVNSTTRSKKSELWATFENKTYPISVSAFQPRENGESCEDYTEVFLCHARLYVFADKYLIRPLQDLCLHKLQRTLAKFTLYEERVGDIVELMRYVYSVGDGSDSMDGLRSLLAHYAACVVEDLARSNKFELLLEEPGCLARDLFRYMLKRLA